MTREDLHIVLKGCRIGDRLSQKRLYRQFYNYSMGVCARYARSDEEAEEMVNDAFIRVFSKIDLYDARMSFPGWLHTILIRSAINYLKRFERQPLTVDLSAAQDKALDEDILDQLSAQEILIMVRKLPPSYRATFNLYVVEGYKHNEIAEALNITEGTSRSNLMLARQKLKELALNAYKIRL